MINNSVKRLVNICNREPKQKYSILTFPTHERYETQLCKTGHDFYSFHLPNSKKWNINQTKIPENYHILPEGSVCEYLNYDFILVQSRYWQYDVALQINNRTNIPIIVLDHTLPPEHLSSEQLQKLKSMVGDVNVFISDFSKRLWGIQLNSMVIHHGIDTELFCPNGVDKQKHALTVGNDFINRNYCLHYDWWCELVKDIEGKIVGETEGISKPAKDINELVNEYNTCGVYINTSTTPIPMSLLEAMSCGCAVVTISASMMPEIINNGSNGFISNDLSELKSYINQILSDDDLRDQLGSNARKTILNKFSEDKFIENWNELFNMIYEVGSK